MGFSWKPKCWRALCLCGQLKSFEDEQMHQSLMWKMIWLLPLQRAPYVATEKFSNLSVPSTSECNPSWLIFLEFFFISKCRSPWTQQCEDAGWPSACSVTKFTWWIWTRSSCPTVWFPWCISFSLANFWLHIRNCFHVRWRDAFQTARTVIYYHSEIWHFSPWAFWKISSISKFSLLCQIINLSFGKFN